MFFINTRVLTVTIYLEDKCNMCDLYQRFTDLDICMSMSIVNLHICLIMTQNKFLSFIKKKKEKENIMGLWI